MMTNKEFPPGYQVHIDSWENDADYRQTKIISGQTMDSAKFIRDFVSLFRSTHGKGGDNYGANFYMDYSDSGSELDQIRTNVSTAFKKIRDANPEGVKHYLASVGFDWVDFFGNDTEELSDVVSDMVGNFLGYSEHYFFRVFDSIKLYYIPEAIKEVKFE